MSRSVHARRAHMRRSVATWSLRLRPGMQHAGHRARDLEEPAFHRCVDVLVSRSDAECAIRKLSGDRAQTGIERAMLRRCEHADAPEHACMRTRTCDVVGAETAVHGKA